MDAEESYRPELNKDQDAVATADSERTEDLDADSILFLKCLMSMKL